MPKCLCLSLICSRESSSTLISRLVLLSFPWVGVVCGMPIDIPDEGICKHANALAGNILMISEGRSGTDNVFSLKDGLC